MFFHIVKVVVSVVVVGVVGLSTFLLSCLVMSRRQLKVEEDVGVVYKIYNKRPTYICSRVVYIFNSKVVLQQTHISM